VAEFKYKRKQEMEPRPGQKFATVYIKQTDLEHARLRNWLVQIAEHIIGVCEINASMAEWFSSPHRDFRKSTRGEYYTPEDLLTDMINQLALGRDLPEAMLNRWNRLTQATPWQIDMISEDQHKAQAMAHGVDFLPATRPAYEIFDRFE
jgi:hypothetical protein